MRGRAAVCDCRASETEGGRASLGREHGVTMVSVTTGAPAASGVSKKSMVPTAHPSTMSNPSFPLRWHIVHPLNGGRRPLNV